MALLPHIFLFFLTLIFHGHSEVIYEEGYTVKTVFDGKKLHINPHSLLSRSNFHDLLLLDSSNSLFYTLSLPLSQESVVKKFSGNGKPQYSDGDASSAMFNKPRSFTIDLKGNVYVADRSNRAIRKISPSGVTTIAGGNPKETGHSDGPGKNASFSSDYVISFVPEICALLIADHGNQLIRQIDLKKEDCVSSQNGGVGFTKLWVSGLAVSCLLIGLIAGFVIRPYIIRTEGSKNPSKSWTTYLTKLGKQAQTHYFATKNAVANPALQFLRELIISFFSLLSLIFNFLWMKRVDSISRSVHKNKEYVSLLDSDNSSNTEYVIMSQKYAEQMNELTMSNDDLGSSDAFSDVFKGGDLIVRDEKCDGQIDNLILANMQSFDENGGDLTLVEGTFLGVSSVVKRR